MSPSNHPLANHSSGLQSLLGAFAMLLAAIVAFTILSGMYPPGSPYFPTMVTLNGMSIPIGAFAWIPLWFLYKHQRYVSYVRPRTTFHAWLDFISSLLLPLVAVIAILSWTPGASAIIHGIEKMISWATSFQFNSKFDLNGLSVVIPMLLFGADDLLINQWRRSQRGWEGTYGGAPEAPGNVNRPAQMYDAGAPMQFGFDPVTQGQIDRLIIAAEAIANK